MTRKLKALVLGYMAGDNDLSPYVNSIARRMARGTQRNPHVRAILMVDKAGNKDSRILDVHEGVVTDTRLLPEKFGIREVDMGRPGVLAGFLKGSRDRYPAQITLVTLIGHGTGPIPTFEWLADTPSGANASQIGKGVPSSVRKTPYVPPSIPYTPQTIPYTPQTIPYTPQTIPYTPANTSEDAIMSTPQLGKALLEATDQGQRPFDLLFLDHCFNGNLDVLYEFHPVANLFIASPNYAWLIAPYTKYIEQINAADKPETVAHKIIHRYQSLLDDSHPNSIFWLHGKTVARIAARVDDLAEALTRAVDLGQDELVLQAVRASKFVDTQGNLGEMDLGRGDELVGVGSFATNLMAQFRKRDAAGVYRRAAALLKALEKVHTLSISGRPYIAPDQLWDYDDSITLLAPRRRDLSGGFVWRASLYKPQAPLVTILGSRPDMTVNLVQNLKYVHEGKWQAFINHWYRKPLQPTLGNMVDLNRPPMLGFTDAQQSIALRATLSERASVLVWRDDGSPAGAEYAVLKLMGKNLWKLVETVDVDTHQFIDTDEHRATTYVVLLLNDAGVAVARSNYLVRRPTEEHRP